jgi:hypothetical protein
MYRMSSLSICWRKRNLKAIRDKPPEGNRRMDSAEEVMILLDLYEGAP